VRRLPLVAALLLGALPARAQEPAEVDELWRRIDAGPEAGAEALRAAWEALWNDPGPALEAAFGTFASAPPRGRRARAHLLRERGGSEHLPRALALADDPDAAVQRDLIGYCARRDLGPAGALERAAVLERLAGEAADDGVRTAATEALAELDAGPAVAALARLAGRGPIAQRVLAAQALPAVPAAWEPVRDLVAGGFAPAGRERTPAEVLEALLPLYGRLLADREAGGEADRDRAPLVLGLRHPAPEVQGATADAFDQLLSRLRELGEAERALRILEGLARQGLDRRVVEYHRTRLAFYPGADARAAREAARAIRGPETVGDDPRLALWRFRSHYLEGLASLALGELGPAAEALAQAADVLDGTLGRRLDLQDRSLQALHVDALQQRALVEVGRALVALAEGDSPSAGGVLEPLRQAHLLALEAQLAYARLRRDAFSSWDSLLDTDLSPFRLLFTGVELERLGVARGLELQQLLGSGLAGVAAVEMPGFRPPAGPPDPTGALGDPLRDAPRLALLREIQEARLEALDRDLDDAHVRLFTFQTQSPGVVPPPEMQLEIERLRRHRMRLQKVLRDAEDEGYEALLELRIPSALALWLARDLRSEGRFREARELAERMRDDLEENAAFHSFYWGTERLAEIEMAIGSALTDAGRAREAEVELLRAVERLEDLERKLEEGGGAPRQTEGVRALRCNALVSLAVNANVKLEDPERALEFFERAYELRRDDFMRVLLACYRARSGRRDEALALLREVRPGPQVYYNMACTYALLGESARALELLERDLNENHASAGSRRRQLDWARADPDLDGVRDDPRFQRLVGDGDAAGDE